MNRNRIQQLITAVALSSALVAPALAQDAGDWEFGFGVGVVAPNTSSDDLVFEGTSLDDFRVDVDDKFGIVVNATYFMSSNWGLELLASTPWKHDVNGAGALEPLGELGSVKQLPPTLSLQYHFRPNQTIRPYVGAGLNYTLFFDESTTTSLHEGIVATANGALGTNYSGGSTDLSVDDSFGLALQAGFDIELTEAWFLNFDLRWIDIGVDAELQTNTFDGDDPITLNSALDIDIDPWVFSTTVGFRF